MIQQLLGFLPGHLTGVALMVSLAGAVLGLILWLGGSRYNRMMVTLASVSSGVVIGLQVPAWFGLKLEGWATATLAAIVLGISGFALHKLWIGLGLGVTLTLWAALGTFIVCNGILDWHFSAWKVDSTVASYLNDLWMSLSEPCRRMLPFTCALALISGFAIAVLWARLGVVLLYSSLGITLLLSLGILAMHATQPQWLKFIPSQTSSQVIVLISLVVFGAVCQWRVAPAQHRMAQRQVPVRH